MTNLLKTTMLLFFVARCCCTDNALTTQYDNPIMLMETSKDKELPPINEVLILLAHVLPEFSENIEEVTKKWPDCEFALAYFMIQRVQERKTLPSKRLSKIYLYLQDPTLGTKTRIELKLPEEKVKSRSHSPSKLRELTRTDNLDPCILDPDHPGISTVPDPIIAFFVFRTWLGNFLKEKGLDDASLQLVNRRPDQFIKTKLSDLTKLFISLPKRFSSIDLFLNFKPAQNVDNSVKVHPKQLFVFTQPDHLVTVEVPLSIKVTAFGEKRYELSGILYASTKPDVDPFACYLFDKGKAWHAFGQQRVEVKMEEKEIDRFFCVNQVGKEENVIEHLHCVRLSNYRPRIIIYTEALTMIRIAPEEIPPQLEHQNVTRTNRKSSTPGKEQQDQPARASGELRMRRGGQQRSANASPLSSHRRNYNYARLSTLFIPDGPPTKVEEPGPPVKVEETGLAQSRSNPASPRRHMRTGHETQGKHADTLLDFRKASSHSHSRLPTAHFRPLYNLKKSRTKQDPTTAVTFPPLENKINADFTLGQAVDDPMSQIGTNMASLHKMVYKQACIPKLRVTAEIDNHLLGASAEGFQVYDIVARDILDLYVEVYNLIYMHVPGSKHKGMNFLIVEKHGKKIVTGKLSQETKYYTANFANFTEGMSANALTEVHRQVDELVFKLKSLIKLNKKK